MTGMVTMTQNDRAPELLAHLRRGPGAQPTEAEKYEYLLARKTRGAAQPQLLAAPRQSKFGARKTGMRQLPL